MKNDKRDLRNSYVTLPPSFPFQKEYVPPSRPLWIRVAYSYPLGISRALRGIVGAWNRIYLLVCVTYTRVYITRVYNGVALGHITRGIYNGCITGSYIIAILIFRFLTLSHRCFSIILGHLH